MRGSRLGLAVGILLGLTAAARGGSPAELTAQQLARMTGPELAALFAGAEVGRPPAGVARGRVILMTDGRLPRVRAGLASVVWRGKVFADDGSFANRWAGGIRAGGSRAVVEPSWADGRPAVVMVYPAGSLVFSNTRDEVREVAPGLYLGAFYDRCPCPRLRGYFVLQTDPCR